MNIINAFFKPMEKIEGINKADYESLSYCIAALEAISRMIDLSYYIVDYKKREFISVSGHPLFLAGYEREQVRQMGYDFFGHVVPTEDLNVLLEVNEKGFEFFYNLPPARRPEGFMSYDFRIRHKNGSIILVNNKLTPVILNLEGNLWISLCLVTLSSARKPGNMYIYMKDEGVKYNYSVETKKFLPTKSKPLSATEKLVIQHLSMGKSTREIARLLYLSEDTIKFHKKNIYKKLDVKNSNEAVYMTAVQK